MRGSINYLVRFWLLHFHCRKGLKAGLLYILTHTSSQAPLFHFRYLSLADLANCVVTACNKLRYSTPVALLPTFTKELQNFVDRANDSIIATKTRLESAGREMEKSHFEDMEAQVRRG